MRLGLGSSKRKAGLGAGTGPRDFLRTAKAEKRLNVAGFLIAVPGASYQGDLGFGRGVQLRVPRALWAGGPLTPHGPVTLMLWDVSLVWSARHSLNVWPAHEAPPTA